MPFLEGTAWKGKQIIIVIWMYGWIILQLMRQNKIHISVIFNYILCLQLCKLFRAQVTFILHLTEYTEQQLRFGHFLFNSYKPILNKLCITIY